MKGKKIICIILLLVFAMSFCFLTASCYVDKYHYFSIEGRTKIFEKYYENLKPFNIYYEQTLSVKFLEKEHQIRISLAETNAYSMCGAFPNRKEDNIGMRLEPLITPVTALPMNVGEVGVGYDVFICNQENLEYAKFLKKDPITKEVLTEEIEYLNGNFAVGFKYSTINDQSFEVIFVDSSGNTFSHEFNVSAAIFV